MKDVSNENANALMDEWCTLRDRIRNENIRKGLGIANIVEKMKENCLRWIGHVQRRGIRV